MPPFVQTNTVCLHDLNNLMELRKVLSQIEDVIKYFNPSRCDDWVDRLSHVYTALLLLVFAAVVSTSHLVGEPMKCWIPAEYHKKDGHPFDKYVNNYCWIKNTYIIPMLEEIPTDISRRQDEEITYYQWVPLILCLLALFFKLPHVIWKLLHTSSGLDLDKLSELVESGQDEVVSIIVGAITRWIKNRQQNRKDTLLVRTKTWGSRYCCFFGSKRDGTYLTALYLVTKLLYLVNAVGQIVLLNAFITTDASLYALEWLRTFTSAPYFVESKRFPRVTLCDYQIRQMNNIHRYTVQCVLPINLFNEKLFLFLWFWFCLVALLNIYKMSNWLDLILRKKNNYTFIKKYLKIGSRELNASDKHTCRKFAEEYLRGDGCFVLRMLEMNSTGFVVLDVVNELFTNYQKST